jgi:hypothetical protein
MALIWHRLTTTLAQEPIPTPTNNEQRRTPYASASCTFMKRRPPVPPLNFPNEQRATTNALRERLMHVVRASLPVRRGRGCDGKTNNDQRPYASVSCTFMKRRLVPPLNFPNEQRTTNNEQRPTPEQRPLTPFRICRGGSSTRESHLVRTCRCAEPRAFAR